MSDLDLPQISFARYLELLRRRWWQVVPVTFVGLMIGAVAAFLIPRYYVADTTFVFQGGDAFNAQASDPMTTLVANAQVSIPATVESVLGQLGWPEANDENIERRRKFVESVTGRIIVIPIGDPRLQSNRINLQVLFKDTDGPRAAQFANALVKTWTEAERERVLEQGKQALADAQIQLRQATEQYTFAQNELKNHREKWQIDPDLEQGLDAPGRTWSNPKHDQAKQLRGELLLIERNIAKLQSQIQSVEDSIAGMQKTMVRSTSDVLDPAREAEYQTLVQQHKAAETTLATFVPNTSKWLLAKAQFDEIDKKLQEVAALRTGPERTVVDDPNYRQIQANLALWRGEKQGLEREKSVLEAELAKVDAIVQQWPVIGGQLSIYRDNVSNRQKVVESATLEVTELQSQIRQFRNQQPFRIMKEATVPPRPTEPNIVLVALAGSLVGLAGAIGLILLLDFMQSSFKTVHDVERALPVPILGMLAHLETAEERQHSVAHRRRISLAAGVFLFLGLSVVTIYFVAPTKLPPSVTNLFDLVLGAPMGGSNAGALDTPK